MQGLHLGLDLVLLEVQQVLEVQGGQFLGLALVLVLHLLQVLEVQQELGTTVLFDPSR